MSKNFLVASRAKIRFSSDKVFHGINATMLTTEQLWDIPLTAKSRNSINHMYTELEAKLKESEVSGLVKAPSIDTSEIKLKLDILREVFEIRTAENKLVAEAAAKAEKRKELEEALSASEQGELKSKSPAELRAMLAEL